MNKNIIFKKIVLSILLFFSVMASASAEIIYINWNDWNKIYKKTDETNGSWITQNQASTPKYSHNWQYIIYRNQSDWGTCYRKNANDTGDGEKISSYSIYCWNPTYSIDDQYIVYSNSNDGNKLYKKNANDTGDGSAITSVSSWFPTYSPDGQYIIYTNFNDWDKIYRKNANDTGNGSAITSIQAYYPNYSPNGQYIIFQNINTWFLYKKNANDTGDGSAITSVFSYYNAYSPDGQYIVYWNWDDWYKMYKKNANDTGNGSAITTIVAHSPAYAPWLPGVCGSNARVFDDTETSFDGSFCSYGSADPSSPSFPTYGTTSDWTCADSVGWEVTQCSAYREIPNAISWSCGTNARLFLYTETSYGGTFCTTGTADPSSPSFPSYGTAISWECTWSYGGIDRACQSSRQSIPRTCATAPTGWNYGSLTYNPTSYNQSWVYSTIGSSCSYTCINGYTGTWCTTAPVYETGTETDTWFWWSLFSPITNFFADLLGWLRSIFVVEDNLEPYGLIFSDDQVISLSSLSEGNKVACWQNIWWYYSPSTLLPVSSCTVTSEWWAIASSAYWSVYTYWNTLWWDYMNWDIWNYKWYKRVSSWWWCWYWWQEYSNWSIDVKDVIDTNGDFNYLRNKFWTKISSSNMVNIFNDFSMTVNLKYDIVIFWFSLTDLLNSTIEVVVSIFKYIIQYILTISDNILDLISMFFYDYQDGNACYFWDVYPIKSQITETWITHTQNTGLLDLFFYLLFSFWIFKKFKSKFNL